MVEKHKKLSMSREDKIFYAATYALLAVIGLCVSIPLIYILAASFSSSQEVIKGAVFLIPKKPTLDGYKAVFENKSIVSGYTNSLFYVFTGTAINIVMTVCAAYPLSRKDLPGGGFFMMLFTFTMVFSGGMITTYMLISDLGMLNTVWAMIIPGAISVYNMIITRTFFKNNIPQELWEAAQVDGCSDLYFFWKMVLPLSKSIIAVITLYYAISHWNAYFNAFLYLTNKKLFPLQIILREILVVNQVNADMISDEAMEAKEGLSELLKYSLIVVSVIPVMIIYPFVQKHFVKGVMIGSVKG